MAEHDFPGRGKVAVVKSRPETVLGDVGRAMELAGYRAALTEQVETLLKLNVTSETWRPGASTTPWQLEGVIRRLREDDGARAIAVQGAMPGVDTLRATRNNKLSYVLNKYRIEDVHLAEPEVEWGLYEPRAEMLVLHDIFPEGIHIPRMFIGKNVIQLPPSRVRAGTQSGPVVAGAMLSAFDGLLNERRRRAHQVVEQALVDVLTIQREIHPGIFAVMDGTLVAAGFGQPQCWNVVLASADQVALDAVSAQLQGVDPLSLASIRLAQEKGLGVGDPQEIEIAGQDISAAEWVTQQLGQTAFNAQAPGSLTAARSEILPWNLFRARRQLRQALDTPWGALFKSYDDGRVVQPGPDPKSLLAAGIGALLASTLLFGLSRRKAP